MTSIPKIAWGMHSCCTNEEAKKIVVDESSVSIYDLPDPFNVKVYQPIFVMYS